MFPSSKEVILHNFRQFLENWIFDGNLTGADLTKIVKFCTILNCDKKIFFWLNDLFPSSKEVILHNFRQFLENWIFDKNLTGADLSEILYYLKLWWKYFLAKWKRKFLHNFRQFLENWIFVGNSTGADLTKIVKFCTILNCDKKIFFG